MVTPISSKSCIVAGHILPGCHPDPAGRGRFESTFRPGRLLEAGPAVMSTGGAVSNTGLAMHKLGINTQLMGKIGPDLFGQAILDVVKSHGGHLSEGMHIVPGEASSYTVILNPPNVTGFFCTVPERMTPLAPMTSIMTPSGRPICFTLVIHLDETDVSKPG